MNNIYKSMLNEHINQYRISSLTNEEALSALTGVQIIKMKTALQVHGLPDLIKYSGIILPILKVCSHFIFILHLLPPIIGNPVKL